MVMVVVQSKDERWSGNAVMCEDVISGLVSQTFKSTLAHVSIDASTLFRIGGILGYI